MSYDSGKFVHSNPPPTSKPPLPRSDVRTIDQWEAELKKELEVMEQNGERINPPWIADKYFALIDLVRKKDEKFKYYTEHGSMNWQTKLPALEGLALTDELK